MDIVLSPGARGLRMSRRTGEGRDGSDHLVPTELEVGLMETATRGVGVGTGSLIAGPVGAVAGFILAEVAGTLFNLRDRRIRLLFEALESRLSAAEREIALRSVAQEEGASFLQEAMLQAARRGTAQRVEQLAELAKNGLVADDDRRRERERLMSILNELNDDEVVLLRSVAVTPARDTEFRERHRHIVEYSRPHDGAPEDAHERYAVWDSYWNHLDRLGLISRQRKPASATLLGRVLLIEVGLLKRDQH